MCLILVRSLVCLNQHRFFIRWWMMHERSLKFLIGAVCCMAVWCICKVYDSSRDRFYQTSMCRQCVASKNIKKRLRMLKCGELHQEIISSCFKVKTVVLVFWLSARSVASGTFSFLNCIQNLFSEIVLQRNA